MISRVGGTRFIPACVGNSPRCSPHFGCAPVHPRVCGELAALCQPGMRYPGSSPRVWGTRCRYSFRNQPLRFIPACVGNSISVNQRNTLTAVHPRVCGELDHLWVCGSTGYGSSPRVWGTPVLSVFAEFVIRFIPACVGNSRAKGDRPAFYTVHPRVCGELGAHPITVPVRVGSSPRVWGTQHR